MTSDPMAMKVDQFKHVNKWKKHFEEDRDGSKIVIQYITGGILVWQDNET